MRGAEGAGGDDGGTPTRQASDAMDAGGLQGFHQAHRRQDGGQAPRQPRRARSWGLRSRTLWSECLHRVQLY